MKINFQKNIDIRNLLIGAFVLLIAFLISVIIITRIEFKKVMIEYNEIAEYSTTKLNLLGEMKGSAAMVQTALMRHAIFTESSDMDREEALINERYDALIEKFGKYEKMIEDSIEHRLFNNVISAKSINTKVRDELIALDRTNNVKAIELKIQQQRLLFNKLEDELVLLSNYADAHVSLELLKVQHEVYHFTMRINYSIFVCSIFVLFLGFIIAIANRKMKKNNEVLKESEEKILTSEKYLENIINSVASPIFVKDVEHKFILVNDAFCLLHNLLREKIIGTTGIEFIEKEQMKVFIAKDEEVFKTGKENISEELLTDDLGVHRTLITRKILFSDPLGDKFVVGVINDVSERKQSEREQQRLSKAIINSTEVVFMTDKNGIFDFVNPEFTRMYGYTAEEVVGKVTPRILKSEGYSKEDYDQFWKTLLEKKNVKANQYKNTHKDGRTIDVEASAHPILDDNNDIVGFLGIQRDITARKNEEKRKIQDEESIHTLSVAIEQSPVITVITDLSGNIVYVNPKFLEITGYTIKEVIGKNPRLLNTGQTTKAEYKKLWDTILSGENWHGVFQNKKKNGELYWESAVISPIRNKDGIITNFLAVNEDITEKRKAVDALSESALRYKTLFEKASQGIVFLSERGKILGLNESFAEMHGYSVNEMLKMDVKQLDTPEMLKILPEIFARVLSGEQLQFETTHYHKNGSVVTFAVSSSLIKVGKESYIQSFLTNITDRKKNEELLKEQNKELVKTNVELDRFVYSTSHDLRAPLSSLLGMIAMVSEETEGGNVRQIAHLKMMEESVLKLDRFIEGILDYSRNSRMEVEREEIDFKKAVQDVRENLKFMDGTSGMNLRVEIVEKEKFVSDKRRVNMVLSNLISNAIKYRDLLKTDSFIEVVIQTFKVNAIIVVKDNGIGMSESAKGKIFDMFYRASKQSTGSGLGLYIVKETIEKLKGSISVESQKSVGSKFTVIIPNLLNDESKERSAD